MRAHEVVDQAVEPTAGLVDQREDPHLPAGDPA
ncbi:hypothetical protein F4554_005352 [Actinopolymorpha rutila]|uniref:Uncharacterized protein n=1 Tax=Actinopolymorpha rutila TaxID=446787 RepID=A0A852ZID4_9ACTN|nr:hypothetical protein [Actinopolymorpha rutila]